MMLKKMMALVVAVAVALGGISYSGVVATQVSAAETGWNLVWSDEFDGTSLNTNDWNYEIGTGNWGWGNNEHEYYTNREENVEVSNGTLKIKALKEAYNGSDYTSGRITTKGKQEFKYGKIEARIKLPQFTGAWPAFWTLGANQSTVGWPRCGEIDIMEGINAENFTYGALHWYTESSNPGQGDTSSDSIKALGDDYQRTEWHTYGILWDEGRIQWYVDDQIFLTKYISSSYFSEFQMDHFIILNLAIGGEWPGHVIDDTAFPAKSIMEVDYVRVYEEVEIPTTVEETTPSVKKSKIKEVTKKAENTVKVSLKKIKDVTGYKVKVSTTKKFKKKNTVTKTVKRVKFNIKSNKLKNATKLFVKVRAYKEIDGTKYYGKWSNVKKIKLS